jgi:succinate dehydrogenase hydrophobic anchor subunit
VTAVALIPLTLWLFFSLLLLPDLEFSTVKSWLGCP